ncbi:MAG: peptidase C45 [Bacteroidetes bacterium 4572_77]|nr:MAG: peptidase C45 [Bacteroidetes bacterium 4572_77]
MKRIAKIIGVVLGGFLGLLLLFLVYFFWAIQIEEPKIDKNQIHKEQLLQINDTSFIYQDAWLRKNSYGLWEMYISGSPTELGIKNGILSEKLMHFQEAAFVEQLREMIPSDNYLSFLKYVTAYMNRKLPDYIPIEYQNEIKAVSLFSSPDFSFIGDSYMRQLNYHAAHDIGHAMQNLHLVECTAFGVWGSRSEDSSLLIGRNFDFYVGDAFAKNKIVQFVKPTQGYAFSSITWAGMIGVLSGMNNQGLSITLNSAKADIPFTAKTPVSIIAREILQYSATINQAFEIAKKRRSFVAESFMIASANDHRVAIIEKTPDTTILYQTASEQIELTNHFQSDYLSQSEMNIENEKENVTTYRFKRVKELLARKKQFDPQDFVAILRNTKGLKDADIGLGNEGAINQLIAHHSVVFKPQERRFWISTFPYQEGPFLCYQLDSIFNNTSLLKQANSLQSPLSAYKSFVSKHQDIPKERIAADSVFLAQDYLQFLKLQRERTYFNRLYLSKNLIKEMTNQTWF